jgi:hypothetical protein
MWFEKPAIEVPEVREELAIGCVELLGEGAADVPDVLVDGPFMAVVW